MNEITQSARYDTGAMRLIRLVMLGVIALILGVYIASVAARVQVLQQPCVAASDGCNQTPGRLGPEDLARMRADGVSLSAYTTLEIAKLLLFSGIWFGVGGLILARRTGQWMALVAAFMLITFPTTFDGLRETLVRVHPELWMPAQIAGLLSNLGLPLFLALFPNGRWEPRWVRWVALAYVVFSIAQAFLPAWMNNTGPVVEAAQFALGLGLIGLLLAAQGFRYRRISTPTERAQVRWVVLGFCAAMAIVAGMIVVWATGLVRTTGWIAGLGIEYVYQTGVVLIPITIGIAILRYRLFDIDFIVRRTLVYSTLTALLALVFVGSIVVIQAFFRALTGQGSQIATVASTLAVAALFAPLRRRVQDTIDRRFFRRKYDRQKVLAAFATRMQHATSVPAIVTDIEHVIAETVQPTVVGVSLVRPPSG